MALSANVQKTATVGVASATVENIEEARLAVGAPDDAIVQTNGGYYPGVHDEEFPVPVTFSWPEEL